MGCRLFASRRWRLLQYLHFAVAVCMRSGCQSLQGLELPVAREGRLCKVRQGKQLARFPCGSRNEEVKCKVFTEAKAESFS